MKPWLSVIVLVSVAGCGGQSEVRILPGTGLVEQIIDQRFGNTRRIIVTIKAEVPVGRVVDMPVFEPLRPGMRFRDAEKLLGIPSKTWQKYRDEYRGYTNSYGTVTITHEVQVSGGLPGDDSYRAEFWTVSAFPKGLTLSDFVTPSVLSQIPMTNTCDVRVVNTKLGDAVDIWVQEGAISRIRWVNSQNRKNVQPGDQGDAAARAP